MIDAGKGDPDLLMHYLVTRSSGVTILGSSPQSAVGQVPRATALRYLCDELAWALDEADQRYAVLNACRAVAFCEDGDLLSKMAGGARALERASAPSLVQQAMDAQTSGHDLGPSTPGARAFVKQSIARIEAEITTSPAHR